MQENYCNFLLKIYINFVKKFIFNCVLLVNALKNGNIKKYSHRECVSTMTYVKKICPFCGKEFFVLENAEDKAVYCTMACLTKAQEKFESRGVAFPGIG